MANASSDIIRLNVGGVVFMTNLSTLLSCPSSSLAMMFSPSSPHQPPPTDSSGAYFLDSSPDMFRHVLDWCRYKQLLVDKNQVDWNSLVVVADYFGLEDMMQAVVREKEQQEDRVREMNRVKAERHREMKEAVTEIREMVSQLVQSMERGGHPRPRGPRPPIYPDPDFPFPPGPEYM